MKSYVGERDNLVTATLRNKKRVVKREYPHQEKGTSGVGHNAKDL